MRNKQIASTLLLYFCIIAGVSYGHDINGKFFIKDDVLTCVFFNQGKEKIALIGLNRAIQTAKFYSKEKSLLAINRRKMPYPILDAAREWVVISGNLSESQDPMSVYAFVVTNVDLPDLKALQHLDNLILDVSIRKILRNAEITKEEKVEIRLEYLGDK